MNSRNLIVAFVAVSIAALIVSSFAVFSVARTYSTALANNEPSETVSVPEITYKPESSVPPPAESSRCETEAAETSEEITLAEITLPEDSSVTATEPITEESTFVEITGFTLSLSGDRLIITDVSSDRVYERIIDVSSLHPKDREALLDGIVFPDRESAMSAVYDLIS